MLRKLTKVVCLIGALLTGIAIVFSGACSDSMHQAVSGAVAWDCRVGLGGWHGDTPGVLRESGAIVIVVGLLLGLIGHGLYKVLLRVMFRNGSK